ncbi:MAG: hypothetical protein KKH98_02715 [Spirochaetes bacterium]|nr:hypothetical protein [Spirochaetota bacterium]
MIKRIIFLLILIIGTPVFVSASGATSSIMDLNTIAYDAGFNLACYGKSVSLESLAYNPAYALSDKHTIGVSAGIMGLDMNYFSASYVGRTPFSDKLGWGGVFKYLTTGSVQGYDAAGTETESITASDMAFSGVVGWKLNDTFHIGTRINIVSEKIEDSNTGYGFDLAGGMKFSLFKQTSLNFGVTVLNVYSVLWDEIQPVGVGSGLVFDTKLGGQRSLEYGAGLKMDETEEMEIGGSVRYSDQFHVGQSRIDFKIGAGYYYSETIDETNGIKAGALIGFHNWYAGYDLFFRPWGTENRITLSYAFPAN